MTSLFNRTARPFKRLDDVVLVLRRPLPQTVYVQMACCRSL